jgi:hypothetical protein
VDIRGAIEDEVRNLKIKKRLMPSQWQATLKQI